MAVVTICFPFRRLSSTPFRMAQLSLSVPQEVKYTSPGAQPSARAAVSRYPLTRSAACRPHG